MSDIEDNDHNSGIIANDDVKNSGNTTEDSNNTVTVVKTDTETKSIDDSFNDKTVTVSGNTVDSNNKDIDVTKTDNNVNSDNTLTFTKNETENKTIDSFNQDNDKNSNNQDNDSNSNNTVSFALTKNETENKAIDSFNKVNVDITKEDNDKTITITKETDSHDKTATNSFNDNDTATDSYNKTVSVSSVEDSYNKKIEDSFNEKKVAIDSFNTTTTTDSHDSLLNLKDEVLKIDDSDLEGSVVMAKALGQDVSGAGDDIAFSFEQVNNLVDQDKLWNPEVKFYSHADDDIKVDDGGIGGSGFVQWANLSGGGTPESEHHSGPQLANATEAIADAAINQSAFNQNIVMGANIQVNDLSITIGHDDILPS
ncbi:MAG TPA: hypothetical protein VNL39_01470 [Xanthobacteraceae bacterium]|nr:hypothetical protein [Xanthobacteraceae bacterium]